MTMDSQKLKAFISYSHADEAKKDELIKFMRMLQRNGILENWNDRELLAGDKLDAEIQKNLDDADITILLVSQDFIASYYCYEIELQRALEMENKDGKRVVAIILDHCTWKQTPIKDYVLLPQDATPITEYQNQNKAWLEISEELEEICKKQKKK